MRPRPRHLLRPDRLRSIERERPFGWLSCRLLTQGLLSKMSTSAKLLYMHLALAGDHQGISFWGDRRIQKALDLAADKLERAREQLINLDLLAFDGHRYQLLSLPDHAPPMDAPQREAALPDDSVTSDGPAEIPEEARRILRRLLGRDFSG